MSDDPGVHVFPMRIYFEDTDAGGIVYYANYLRFAERARTEMLRLAGIESSDLMATSGIAFAVKECHMEFLKPARLDDAIQVETRITSVGGASLRLDQKVLRQDERLVDIDVRLACMGGDGRPKRLPADVVGAVRDLAACHENATTGA